ncbi:elongation factor G [Planctomycetota bacterium]|nr:elongation factor G [Planctomycetota bacterium]
MAKKKKAKAFPLDRVRNIGIIAHIDAGKTTTTEQILFYSGQQHKLGSVDDGNTTTDFDPEEAQRGITIYSAAVTTHWTPEAGDEHRINIIDTPGHIDFTAEVERALRVLDGAIGVFCGVAGVQAQSETVWRQADTYGVPRIAFVNKLDRMGANFDAVVENIQDTLGGCPIRVQLPIGLERDFQGVIDLITMKALTWEDSDAPPPPTQGPIPEDMLEDAEFYRGQMIEALGDADDVLAEKVMEEQEITIADIRAALRRVTLARTAFPILCGSSKQHKGAQPLLDAICHYLPAPPDRPPIEGKKPKAKRVKTGEDRSGWIDDERAPTEADPFCALAFKTVSSPTGELVYLRVYSGSISTTTQLLNMRENKKERMGRVYVMSANRKNDPVETARVGDILGVVGLRYTATGDTLCDQQHPIVLGRITFPLPVVSMAVEPRSTSDRDKLQTSLERLAKDDPTFTIHEDADTGQTVISGMGELHLEIIANRLKREWKVECKVGKPRVSYKQTVKTVASGRAEYVLELGEKKMFAAVELELTPKEGATGGLEIEFTAPADAIPEEFYEPVEDAIRSRCSSVGDWGDPMIDVLVRVTGGQFVKDESNDSAYGASASRAVDAALKTVKLVSLEPVMSLTVDVPEEFYGNIVQDLQGRRAEIQGTEMIRETRRLTAVVPLAEMFGYASDVRSRSQGRANFSMEPKAYAPVPEGKRPKLF